MNDTIAIWSDEEGEWGYVSDEPGTHTEELARQYLVEHGEAEGVFESEYYELEPENISLRGWYVEHPSKDSTQVKSSWWAFDISTAQHEKEDRLHAP